MSDAPVMAIFGATSDIAAAVARRVAEDGWRLVLVGRFPAAVAADCSVRGATAVHTVTADFADIASLQEVADRACMQWDRLDVALVAYGTLPDQAATETDASAAVHGMMTNYVGQVILCNGVALNMARHGRGTIAVITSVAGLRGRKSNHLYGSAKGGLQRFLQGLRHRLFGSGVRVLDIRPGFVSTKMNAHLAQAGPLWATPDQVAADIIWAIRRNRSVLYTPWFWRPILGVVRLLPLPIFHRTRL